MERLIKLLLHRLSLITCYQGKTGQGLYAICCILIFLISLSLNSFAEDRVVAKVGDIKITESELEEALDRYIPPGSFHVNIDRSQKDKYSKDALNDLIEIELLYQDAKKKGINVSDDTVKKIIEENIKRFGSEKKLNEILKKKGLTLDTLRERIRKYQTVNSLLNTFVKESEYPENELKEYYEKNKNKFKRPDAARLYHILIKVEPAAPEEEWKKRKEFAEGLLEKIKSGEDFIDIAYKYSEDPYRVKGGDLGFIHRGMLDPKELEDAAFSLKEGEVSTVIKTIHGFHILKAGEKMPAETLSFEEVKQKLRSELESKRYEEIRKNYLNTLKEKTRIEVY